MDRIRVALGGVVLVALGALVGCAAQSPAAGDPTAAPSATTTPTPTSGPPAALVLFGDRLEIRDSSGEVLSDHSLYDDESALVVALTAAFGFDPQVTTSDQAGDCTAVGTTSYVWAEGEASLSVSTPSPAAVAPWDGLDVRTATSGIGGITIETGAGFSSGDDATAFVAGLPADLRNDSGAFIWDRLTTYDSQPFGGTAIMDEDGIVGFIGTPGLMQSWYC
jgi:hypothetical protein